MRLDVGIDGLQFCIDGLEGDIAEAATEAMREVTPIAQQELREQVVSAGLGGRLANTWRGETYPQSSRSVTPAGYIWTNAPDIVDAFSRGATIAPVNGAKYLWIPTDNVPRQRARVNRRGQRVRGGRMSPEEVENAFNCDLYVRRGRGGTMLAFVDVVRARRAGAFRRATKGRARQGRLAEPILMFVLRRTVRLPKLLNLDAVAERWARNFEGAFSRRLASR